jgi:ribosomal protein S27E
VEPPRPAVAYVRRQPELTAQHRLVRENWPAFERLAKAENDGRGLPPFVAKAVKGYLNCGQLARGFVRVRCGGCGQDQLVAFSCKQRGICASCDGKRMTEGAAHLVESVLPGVPYRQWVLTVPFELRYVLAWNAELRSAVLNAFLRAVEAHYRKRAKALYDIEPHSKLRPPVKLHCGAISVLQRFESSLRLAPHWHVIFADGVWLDPPDRATQPRFLPAPPLRDGDVAAVLVDAVKRITRQVVRRGWTDRNDDPLQERDPALAACLQASLWNRAAKGGTANSAIAKVRGATCPEPKPHGHNCATLDGFSLHANTRTGPAARKDLERLCRYLLRPGVPATRISQTDDGKVRITLKTPWKDGTVAVELLPADFMVRLAALIPLPRHALQRYHGVFAPNAKLRGEVTIAGPEPPTSRRRAMRRAKEKAERLAGGASSETVAEVAERQSVRLSWAQAWQRAFGSDLLDCNCGGRKRMIAVIHAGPVADRILRHLALAGEPDDVTQIRGPPEAFEPLDDGWGGTANDDEPDTLLIDDVA